MRSLFQRQRIRLLSCISSALGRREAFLGLGLARNDLRRCRYLVKPQLMSWARGQRDWENNHERLHSSILGRRARLSVSAPACFIQAQTLGQTPPGILMETRSLLAAFVQHFRKPRYNPASGHYCCFKGEATGSRKVGFQVT